MVSYLQIQIRSKNSLFLVSSFLSDDCSFSKQSWNCCRYPNFTLKKRFQLKYLTQTANGRIGSERKGKAMVCGGIMFPIDSWAAADVDSPAIATQLSAFSLLPYLGFLYFIIKSKSAPKLTLFGFYFLLAFVGGAIPAGIYGTFLRQSVFRSYLNQILFIFNHHDMCSLPTAKVHYVKSLANVDWLHGAAESLLMLTNLFIVLGLRKALREAEDKSGDKLKTTSVVRDEEKLSV